MMLLASGANVGLGIVGMTRVEVRGKFAMTFQVLSRFELSWIDFSNDKVVVGFDMEPLLAAAIYIDWAASLTMSRSIMLGVGSRVIIRPPLVFSFSLL